MAARLTPLLPIGFHLVSGGRLGLPGHPMEVAWLLVPEFMVASVVLAALAGLTRLFSGLPAHAVILVNSALMLAGNFGLVGFLYFIASLCC